MYKKFILKFALNDDISYWFKKIFYKSNLIESLDSYNGDTE